MTDISVSTNETIEITFNIKNNGELDEIIKIKTENKEFGDYNFKHVEKFTWTPTEDDVGTHTFEVNGEEISIDVNEIIDSEANQKLIHRWVLDDVNGTVEDSVGTADGTNNGVVSIDGDYVGGSAGESIDSDYDIETTTLGDFGGNMRSDFAIAYTFATTDSGDYLFGASNSSDSTVMMVGSGGFSGSPTDGEINFILRSQENNSASMWRSTNDTFNDGNLHRVVCNKTGNSHSDIEIWVDGVEVPVNSDDSNNDFGTPTNFDESVYLFSRGGDSMNIIMDDICIYDDSLTQAEIDSYQNPWE